MYFRRHVFILAFIALIVPLISFAEVNHKNGGFYISYTDLLVSGGDHDLSVTRTYNSKSKDKGWFGIGWGSPYETRVEVSGDGSVFVIENGSGAKRRFVPKLQISPEESIREIFKAARLKKDFISESHIKKLTEQFKTNAEIRYQYFKKYNIEAKIADGTTLYSSGVIPQTLIKDKDGYRRIISDSRTEYFNTAGQLIKITDQYNYVVEIEYKDDLPLIIRNSLGIQILLEWNSRKMIKAATSTGDKKTQYQYNLKDDLIESTDINGQVYKYVYDYKHNMTSIAYADKTGLQIRYKKDFSVSELVERNGDVFTYKYEKGPKNPTLHYWTIVSKKHKNSKVTTSRFEYEMKIKLDGQEYLYRTYTEIFGIKKETIYSECCSLPLKITEGGSESVLEYDVEGKLLKKVSKGSSIQYEYDAKTKKVTKYTNNDEWMSFEYDKRGNLIKTSGSDGRVVMVNYNRLGEVVTLSDSNTNEINSKRVFSLKYSATGKPTLIDLSNVGVVQISYDGYGEVKAIDSSGGEKVALAVFDAFQSIVNLFRPAGVSIPL